jgi:hypothetical protein
METTIRYKPKKANNPGDLEKETLFAVRVGSDIYYLVYEDLPEIHSFMEEFTKLEGSPIVRRISKDLEFSGEGEVIFPERYGMGLYSFDDPLYASKRKQIETAYEKARVK